MNEVFCHLRKLSFLQLRNSQTNKKPPLPTPKLTKKTTRKTHQTKKQMTKTSKGKPQTNPVPADSRSSQCDSQATHHLPPENTTRALV